ncbi:MAG: hypothetical protein WDA09_05605 [Bacteriovoracaceae bacterium]
MKILILLLSLTSLHSFASSKRTDLFDCAYLGDSPLERVIISEMILGKRTYHQLEMISIIDGYEETKSRKVNFKSRHNDKILEFTTGSLRIKIDLFQNISFGRIPDFNIHSYDWHCKEVQSPNILLK